MLVRLRIRSGHRTCFLVGHWKYSGGFREDGWAQGAFIQRE